MATIIGRKEEITLLRSCEKADRSTFVAVYGRRRVGKTFLIRNAFDNAFAFHLTGLANVSAAEQLANFQAALVRYFPDFEDEAVPETWFVAFRQLEKALETLPGDGKKTVFLDELPWLDAPGSAFVSAIEHFWNAWASARADINLVVCGSAASWMIGQLLNNTGGLFNRITHHLRLEPFTLGECEAFFQSRAPGAFPRYQILQLYMALGGVPFYLDFIDPSKSAAQNINALCFTARGRLRGEFDKLFASLFKKSEKHVAVIEALARRAKGMERDALLVAAKLPNGGNSTTVLRELEESQFIRRYNGFGKRANKPIYQLCDFFSLFHLKFIRANAHFDDDFWINGLDSPEIRAWSGYAFEQICLAHLRQLKKALGIASVQTQSASWLGTASDGQKAQIDLLIDRRDQVINLCEMKFSIRPFSIEKAYAESLRQKIGAFRDASRTTKAIWLTFVTTFGLAENEHSRGLVQAAIEMDALFD